jgi:hypothetical protein
MRIALLILAILGASVSAGWFAFVRYAGGFPELAPGIYSGLMVDSSRGSSPWLVVREEGHGGLTVALGDEVIQPQKFSSSELKADTQPKGGLTLGSRRPLMVGTDKRVRFVGAGDSGSVFGGDFEVVTKSQRGTWTLVRRPDMAISQVEQGDLTRWYSLWREVEGLEREITQARTIADRNRDSVVNLDHHIGEGQTLRATANRRLGHADSQVEAAREELRQRQQQLDRSISDFELTRRISPEGKLAHLSRETLQRESRWIELTLKLLAPETSLGFDQALERAERVQELKRKIAEQRRLKLEAGERERYQGRSPETSSEEQFYGQLQ